MGKAMGIGMGMVTNGRVNGNGTPRKVDLLSASAACATGCSGRWRFITSVNNIVT